MTILEIKATIVFLKTFSREKIFWNNDINLGILCVRHKARTHHRLGRIDSSGIPFRGRSSTSLKIHFIQFRWPFVAVTRPIIVRSHYSFSILRHSSRISIENVIDTYVTWCFFRGRQNVFPYIRNVFKKHLIKTRFSQHPHRSPPRRLSDFHI